MKQTTDEELTISKFGLHLLDHAGQIASLEKLFGQFSIEVNQFVNQINKVNNELASKLIKAEQRIAELERLSVDTTDKKLKLLKPGEREEYDG